MLNKEIINKVKEIILKHSNPERIYLFGSYVTNEHTKSSDIDIAYFDNDFHNNELIQEGADQIDTLIKLDIKNIAFADKRFRERVQSTGKVIYSNSKKLRYEDSLHNFSKALERLIQIINEKKELDEKGYAEYFPDIAIKRFEFTYEMAWKTIKRYLDYTGLECNNPRSCFKEAYAQGLIENEHLWLEMIEARNLSSHIYDENEITEISHKINSFVSLFNDLQIKLEAELQK